jgi:hypothetical protein
VISLTVGIVFNLDGALRLGSHVARPAVPLLVGVYPDARPGEIDIR